MSIKQKKKQEKWRVPLYQATNQWFLPLSIPTDQPATHTGVTKLT